MSQVDAAATAEPEPEPEPGPKPRARSKAKRSAGILLFELRGGELEVLLVHPGGPFWARRDPGVWSIPKGEYGDEEDPRAAALREFAEETGSRLESSRAPDAEPGPPDLIPLGGVKQRNGKLVTAWAARGSFDVGTLSSNTFQLEWPKGAGVREFPEVDRAGWFRPAEARRKLVPAQAEFVDRLIAALREAGHEIADPAPSAE
ncbi:MAG TPA: NUDIX domain-containing protein [Actinocrinis sp.]|jgi:predicted NUDIX family NTP pyrophosphohydrolase